ncbi:DUF6572 domain-containing protein [Agromyces silvae]|uniref:DUF6572 domain-containing protein n=1 Tax=Agromyces silvae TaxID=3388266 RepID=UPI00359FDCD4
MVEDRRWGVDPDQARQLQEKVNTYAGYVLDGSLSKQYPETASGPIRIRLDCAEAPAGHIAHIAAHSVSQLAAHGIDFQVNPKS